MDQPEQVADTQLEIRSYASIARSHSHTFHQLLLPVDGILELDIAGHAGQVDSNHGAIIVAGETHAFRGQGQNRFLVVELNDFAQHELPAEHLWESALLQPYFVLGPELRHLLAYITSLSEYPTPVRRYWTGLLLQSLTESKHTQPQQLPGRLRRAVSFIHRHYTDPITVAEIATAANLSSSHLHALFQTYLQQTPQQYLIDLRLDRALYLLAHSELPVATIAQQVGYAEHSALTRSLRRRRGLTPSQYRQSHRPHPSC